MKIAINSRTSGKFRHEQIGSRDHIITTMMPIRGDTTMNGLMYPDADVKSSFMQLNMMPAPNGHPMVNGEHVPAFHPVAINAFNVGGFIRNPRKKGKRVFVDFCLDVEVANRCDDGKKLISNIEEGKKVGVSTGLSITQVVNQAGSDDFGKAFTRVGHGFNFDHVAILLGDEVAAGDHAGTELILNGEAGDMIVNLEVNELSTGEMDNLLHEALQVAVSPPSWVRVYRVYPDTRTVVYQTEPREGNATKAKLFSRSFSIDENDEISLSDDAVEGVLREEFEPKITTTNTEDEEMDVKLLALAIIGNSANAFTVDDKARLEAMSETEIVVALTANKEQAQAIMVNSGFDLKDYDHFTANRKAFEEFEAKEGERLDGIRSEIVTNSEMTSEMLEGKPEQELLALSKMAEPKKHATHVTNGQSTEATPGVTGQDGVDFSD